MVVFNNASFHWLKQTDDMLHNDDVSRSKSKLSKKNFWCDRINPCCTVRRMLIAGQAGKPEEEVP